MILGNTFLEPGGRHRVGPFLDGLALSFPPFFLSCFLDLSLLLDLLESELESLLDSELESLLELLLELESLLFLFDLPWSGLCFLFLVLSWLLSLSSSFFFLSFSLDFSFSP